MNSELGRSAGSRARNLLPAALFLAILAACNAGTGSGSSGGQAPGEGMTSASATTIAEALAAAGLPCVDLSTRAGVTHVASEAKCSIGGDDVIIRAFKTTEDRDLYMETSANFVEQLSFDIEAPPRLVGPTWIVTTDTRTTADKIRAILGGELR